MLRFISALALSASLASVLEAGEPNASAVAVTQLKKALAADTALAEIASRDFAAVPLTKGDAKTARELIWNAHVAFVKRDRADEVKARMLKDGKFEMPFAFKTFGRKPANGWSLWISMHGGGGTAKRVNDQQWENQKSLYQPEEGLYLAPRAPTNTAALWYEPQIDRLFGRLIEDYIVLEGVDSDRVYLMGYSAGGDGVYQLAPRLADRWAAAAMMAGHPNGVSLLSLRNVPFALQVGGKDAAYNRNAEGRKYGDQLAELRKGDPDGYANFVKIHEDKPHWMDLEDKVALPWMAKFSRNPIPDKVVWKQSKQVQASSYWLAVPPGEARNKSLLTATRKGQAVEIVSSELVDTAIIRLDDRMLNCDETVTVSSQGRQLLSRVPQRTMKVMLQTLQDRGDPNLMFDAELKVALKP